MEIPVKPRVLIVDDSRIVRATLIKHIQGMFDFREALDGEQAWEILLLDPTIRVVISDLTMPKLDGYGLLRRIRESKVSRIRNIPVIVVSGSDEQEERDRAKAAGANDLITKGIATAQLLSRLDVLSKLVVTQQEFERSLEALMQNVQPGTPVALPTRAELDAQASDMLRNAVRLGRNFVLLNVSVGLKSEAGGASGAVPPDVVAAIGQLLQKTIRQTDCVAHTGDSEFMLATGNIHFDSARSFAQRICGAIANANLMADNTSSLLASCGMVALIEFGADTTGVTCSLQELQAIARERAAQGLKHGVSGVVGVEEQTAFLTGKPVTRAARRPLQAASGGTAPDLATLLQWVREGKAEQVMQQIGDHANELKPLLELLLKQPKP